MAKKQQKTVADCSVQKTRKPRTTDLKKRLEIVDARIDGLEKLIAERSALIEKTQSKLNERRSALEKNMAALECSRALRERILFGLNNPDKKSALRQSRAEEKAKLDELAKLLRAQGKSLDQVLSELKGV